MDTDSALLYSELCRLCLDKKGVHDLSQNIELMQDIYLCTGIKVIISNNWPRKICENCLEIVTNAKQLRILAAASETRLKVLFEDEDDLALQIDESRTNGEDCDMFDDNTTSCTDDKNDINNEQYDVRITIKRERSNSSENASNDDPVKKITVRKDLFGASKSGPSPGYMYTEKTKYGISKKYTIINEKESNISYTCAMCPKTFASWKKVYCHQRLHNKNIPCDICGKMFAAKGDLDKHVRIHTGEKPYACDLCDKSFSQSNTLKVHKESVHHKKSTSKSRTKVESDDDEEDSDRVETLVVY